MLKIEVMYAFIAEDSDVAEGVMGFQTDDGKWMPMVGADISMVKKLVPFAEHIKKVTGKNYKIALFTNRGDVTEQFVEQYKREVGNEGNTHKCF